jgi:glycosyltransferase involved in cell wall biosynthesis
MAAARRAAGNAPGLAFEGPLTREAVPARMNAAAAFVLPSLRESFGLVFVEALFAGLPIIYPQGMAVSGWFDDCPFAVPVPPRDPGALADAMDHAVRSEARLKAALAEWQASGKAERFRRSAIAQAYGDALAAARARGAAH